MLVKILLVCGAGRPVADPHLKQAFLPCCRRECNGGEPPERTLVFGTCLEALHMSLLALLLAPMKSVLGGIGKVRAGDSLCGINNCYCKKHTKKQKNISVFLSCFSLLWGAVAVLCWWDYVKYVSETLPWRFTEGAVGRKKGFQEDSSWNNPKESLFLSVASETIFCLSNRHLWA